MSVVRAVLGERGDDGCRMALGRQVLAIAADAGISKFDPYWKFSPWGWRLSPLRCWAMVPCPTG